MVVAPALAIGEFVIVITTLEYLAGLNHLHPVIQRRLLCGQAGAG